MIARIPRNDQNPSEIGHNLQLESRMVARMIEALVDALHWGVLYVHLAPRHVATVADMPLSSGECLVRESPGVVNECRVSPLSTLFF